MKPSDYAVEELALWERAMQEQREAEDRLLASRVTAAGSALMELVEQVQQSRTKADLLLAEAARVKSQYGEKREGFAELAGPDDKTQRGDGAWLWPRQRSGGAS
jgi:hypothetical protein